MQPAPSSRWDRPRKRHRAEYADPVPADLRGSDGWPITRYTRYLEELIETFGLDDVMRWDRACLTRRGERAYSIRCNGADFAAVLDGRGWWNVYEGGTWRREKLAKDKHPVSPGAEWDETPTTWVRLTLEDGVLIGVAHDIDEIDVLVRDQAPPRPPAEWTFRAWCGRELVCAV